MSAIPAIHVIALDTVGSTNDHAKDLARKGYPAGTLITAKRQTSGRGRQGNAWVSQDGNLFMSLILRPPVNAAHSGQLSFTAAVALADVLSVIMPAGTEVALKWPNDVLVHGKKIAGILLEADAHSVGPLGWIVLGMGVNLTSHPDNATAVKEFCAPISAEDMATLLGEKLLEYYALWLQKGFAPIRTAWLRRAAKLDETINVRLVRENFEGTFRGIDERGALLVDTKDGQTRTISSGEVYL